MNEPAADRRERYAAALLGPDAAGSLDSAADELIDAVMAVADAELAAVPPADQTTDRAALRQRIAEVLTGAYLTAPDDSAIMEVLADAVLAVLPEPADRAAVLREAATRYEEILANANTGQDPRYWTAVRDITLGLRHMAAEAQQGAATAFAPSAPGANEPASSVAAEAQPTTQPETEAHPAEHSWAAELYDPLAEEWVPGTRYLVRDRAVNHLAHARAIGPTWKDGTPTARRLVRATTTYTVEPETEPAAGARQDEEPS